MTQHASLTAGRWSAFSLDQQILMIGNEMNRASRLVLASDRASLALAYERVLRLVDLTVEVQAGSNLCRERSCSLPKRHEQIPHVLPGSRADKLTSC